jgi:tRNA G18 (ribose-2'-O)-methylase SpoU
MSVNRGYFGIGVEGITKESNLGNLTRSAHAFGANFFFTVSPRVDYKKVKSTDTSKAFDSVPYNQYDSLDQFVLPQGCQLVGVELVEDSIELPSFRHPTRAAYILGSEMGNLSDEAQARCDHIIKIPMHFCINVGVCGALVMYDRLISTSRFAPRPVRAGGPTEQIVNHGAGLRIKLRTPQE